MTKMEQKENTEKRPIYEVDNSHLPEFCKHNAVANVKFIPIEQVQANDYNPNAVARNEMRLLYLSIFHDTYTMPVVCIENGSCNLRLGKDIISVWTQDDGDANLQVLRAINNLQNGLLLTRQASLTRMEVSTLTEKQIDMQSKSINRNLIWEKSLQNGSLVCGELEEFVFKDEAEVIKAIAQSTVGIASKWESVNGYLRIALNIYLPKEVKHKRLSTIFALKTGDSTKESGLILSVNIFHETGRIRPTKNWQNILDVLLTAFEQKELKTTELEKNSKYVIVDGFHRYTTMRTNKDIYELNNGYLPCVVLDKDINERMASTVRHNRARGKHSVAGMSTIVFDMLQNGKSDQEICKELGLEAEELARLKHITGFSKLFEDVEYGKSWETDKQLKYKKEWKEKEKQNGNAHEQTDTDKAE